MYVYKFVFEAHFMIILLSREKVNLLKKTQIYARIWIIEPRIFTGLTFLNAKMYPEFLNLQD